MNLERIHRVLIRTPNWLGDAVIAVPALRHLRRLFANAHVAIISKRSIAAVYEGEGLADEIIVTEGGAPFAFIREAARLRRTPWDLAVLLQNAIGAALFARAAGARNVAGYPTDGRRILLGPAIPLDPAHSQKHQVYYYMGVAAHLDRLLTGNSKIDQINPIPNLRATIEDRAAAQRILSSFGVSQVDACSTSLPGRVSVATMVDVVPGTNTGRPAEANAAPLIALNPGATNSRAKRWLPDRFAAVADRLAQQTGSRTVIVGTEGDRPVAESVASMMKTPAAVLAGQTSIRELKGVLSYAKLLVSNDTGAAHLAAALSVPTVVVFGPTEHFATRPMSEASRIVRQQVDCSPCMLRDCPIDHRCMSMVSVEEVYEAARQQVSV
jgi:heptosyltransferase-2